MTSSRSVREPSATQPARPTLPPRARPTSTGPVEPFPRIAASAPAHDEATHRSAAPTPRASRRALLAAALPLAVLLACGCAGEEDPSDEGAAADVTILPDAAPAADIVTGWLDLGNIPDPVRECESDADCETLVAAPGACQTIMCAKTTGQCLLLPVDDGVQCDVSNLCYTGQVCSGGLCLGGVAVNCSDDSSCTNDSCSLDVGCVHSPRVGGCDDGDPCTKDEYCDAGVCTHGADICPAQCGNGSCQQTKGETCATCPLDCGPCSDGCTASEFASCAGCTCETCVCDAHPACCTEAWTDECVTACEACGSCTPCGDGACDGSIGEDCASCPADCGACPTGCGVREEPGCAGCGCEECVCDASPFCCDVAWDAACTAACDGCGTACTGCAASEAPGCNGCACEPCVCDLVPSCCTGAWSALCVTACTTECGGTCPTEEP